MALRHIYGGLDAVFIILLCLISVDYLTGDYFGGNIKKTLSSEAGYRGILKKVGMLCIVAVAQLIGNVSGLPDLRSFVVGFYIANEAISITENAGTPWCSITKEIIKCAKTIKKRCIGRRRC